MDMKLTRQYFDVREVLTALRFGGVLTNNEQERKA